MNIFDEKNIGKKMRKTHWPEGWFTKVIAVLPKGEVLGENQDGYAVVYRLGNTDSFEWEEVKE